MDKRWDDIEGKWVDDEKLPPEPSNDREPRKPIKPNLSDSAKLPISEEEKELVSV